LGISYTKQKLSNNQHNLLANSSCYQQNKLYSHYLLIFYQQNIMPYRRLPNTDLARIRAMKTALEIGQNLIPQRMAFSSKTLIRLQKFLPIFEHSIQLQRQSFAAQNKRSKNYEDVLRKARVYLTHFIRVMNMAIIRGELPVETRTYYGFAIGESTVPSLNTENELISWGRRVIDGEEFRIRKGNTPITNPSAAVVKVRYEKFIESWQHYKALSMKTLDYTHKNIEIRKEADEIILSIWNEVEAKFSTLPEEKKRKECEKYGLVYFFRKNEVIKQIPAH
jgi:hypothetical protein